MSTPAQIEASRINATHSTGPTTPEGKAATGRNALKFGLFSTKNCVLPDEQQEYEDLSAALWKRLEPADTLEELYATEIIRSTWRLRRCVCVEHYLAGSARIEQQRIVTRRFKAAHPDADPADAPEPRHYDPDTYEDLSHLQSKVDRARAQAHSALARATAELRRLQTERSMRREIYTGIPTVEPALGIAETKPVLQALAISARQSKDKAVANAETLFARALEVPFAKQSQAQADRTPQPARGSQCPCGSGVKYKRCCGRNAPPLSPGHSMNAAA